MCTHWHWLDYNCALCKYLRRPWWSYLLQNISKMLRNTSIAVQFQFITAAEESEIGSGTLGETEPEGPRTSRTHCEEQSEHALAISPTESTYFRVQECEVNEGTEGDCALTFCLFLQAKWKTYIVPYCLKTHNAIPALQWSLGECAPGVTWSDGSHQFTKPQQQKTNPPFLFPLFWAFTRRWLCYDTNKAQLNMLAFLFGSKRDKWNVLRARCGSAEHRRATSVHMWTYIATHWMI